MGETRHKLVGEADALSWAERVAGAKTVEFEEGLEVVVIRPFGGSEECAERRQRGQGVLCNGIEGAEVHEGQSVGVGEVGAGEGGVEAGGDGRGEGGEKFLFGGGGDAVESGGVFECGAETVR